MSKIIEEFQEKYPTKEDKEKALMKMSDEEIDILVRESKNVYAKIFYSKFKKGAKT